jgi:fructokinase
VAYDHLAADPAAMEHVRTADVVCFGTLAQRHPVARQSISALLDAATQALLVRDLNLHPPHYSVDIVHGSLLRCHLLKLNDDELRTVQTMLGQDDLQNDLDEDTFPLHLLESYGLKLVCVTLEQ